MLSTTDFEEHLSTNMDKITIIKMLLTSQNENRQLQARLNRQNAKLDKQDEEARLREDRLNSRIDELTCLNKSGSESQIRLMDQLAELQRQLKQMSGQYGEMLTKLKKWKDRNKKITRKP
jgi:type I site-specific restriction endonuclease